MVVLKKPQALLFLIFGLCIMSFVGCQQSSTSSEDVANNYPEDLKKVFEVHGGLEQWSKMTSMKFDLKKETHNEKHFIDLKTRKDRVEGEHFVMGFDGTEVWMDADTSYKGDPVFYHNLMFYFLAMPFVLADDGIQYTSTEPITFQGQTYPGIAISYGDSVGTSPEDEYFIHYHPETYEMEWLGYTVTYYTKEKSEKVKWIRYNAWKEYSGLKLPTVLTWYKNEDRTMIEPKKNRIFENIVVSEEAIAESLFVQE